MIKPVDLEAWTEERKDVSRRSHIRRKGETPDEEDIQRWFDDSLGASLKAALAHLPEDEPPLFVEMGKSYPSDAAVQSRKAEAAGEDCRIRTVHGLIVVTSRRILTIEQWERAPRRYDQPLLYEHSIKMVSSYARHPRTVGLLVQFGSKSMSYEPVLEEHTRRLVSVLSELTGRPESAA